MLPQIDERYEKASSVVTREIVGETILVPIRKNVGDLESIYTLNETASRIWALMDGQRSVGEIRDRIVEEFEVGEEEAERDLVELLEQMEAVGVVGRA
jgi:hypothetical protein